MITFTMRRALLGAIASLGILTMAPAAQADPLRWLAPPPPPGPSTLYDAPWADDEPRHRPRAQAVPYARPYGSPGGPGGPQPMPVPQSWVDAQTAQRCNVGRLVGGLVGGAVGYGASRQDGRSWAVPLGALLGQQMGCNLANNRTPLPW